MTEENPPKEETGTTEKLWDATRKGLHVAAFKATKMKRIVQKRIDLAAIHKKYPRRMPIWANWWMISARPVKKVSSTRRKRNNFV